MTLASLQHTCQAKAESNMLQASTQVCLDNAFGAQLLPALPPILQQRLKRISALEAYRCRLAIICLLMLLQCSCLLRLKPHCWQLVACKAKMQFLVLWFLEQNAFTAFSCVLENNPHGVKPDAEILSGSLDACTEDKHRAARPTSRACVA